MPVNTNRPKLKDVMKTKPMKFQFEGIRFLCKNNGRVLLADDMGLGKSLQALAWASLMTGARPLIIVAPANAKFNWEAEIKTHTFLDCQVLEGRKPVPILKDIVIINFDILPWWEDTLCQLKPQALIIDECQNVKTRNITRTQVCKKLSEMASYVIGMSGTPIVNKPVEFFSILNMIQPNEFSNFWKFAFRYCDPQKGWQGRGWDFRGSSHTQELHDRLQNFMIRRMKDDVMTQLPKKRRTTILVSCENKKEYEHAKNNFLEWYENQMGTDKARCAKKAMALVRIGQLKKLAAEGKLKSAFQWIDDFLDSTNEKLVVFVHHKSIFQALWDRYKKIAARGKQKGKQRQIEVDKFQNDKKCKLYIGSTKADGTAITLTAASTVLFLELGWTPAEMSQAEDRIRRIGQTATKINVYYILAKDTIDLNIWDLIEKKRKIIGKILDGEDVKESKMNVGNLVKLLNHKTKK